MFSGSRPYDSGMSSDISVYSSWSIRCVSLGGTARLSVLVKIAPELDGMTAIGVGIDVILVLLLVEQ